MPKTDLTEYSAKRSFSATPEPKGELRSASSGPLLFVIQQHAARHMHYDLRLECDGVLKSWAIPKGLSLDPNDKRLAAHTEDHPYDYASFEGVIPSGQYGAGEMIIWDCGVYSPDEDQQYWFHDRAAAEQRVREGIEQGKLSFILRGEKVKGSFALVRMADRKNWLVIKHKDRYISKSDIAEQDRSVFSGLTVQDLKTLPVPPRVSIATLIPTGEVEAMPAT
ncbi:MAG: ATP-dependent DNA ligase, partial [Burkholderiaceae bacterium]|nr:ATP-dependent DNA ligase [Burkholderiaceae bacterium]